MVKRLGLKTRRGNIKWLSYELYNGVNKVIESGSFFLLEWIIQEIYNSLTWRFVSFNWELKSASDKVDFYKFNIDEKLQRLEKTIEEIMRKKLDETLNYIQCYGYYWEEMKLKKCKKEEEDVEYVINSIKSYLNLETYKKLSKRDDDYLRNNYKKWSLVKIKIDNKCRCTAKVLEVDVKHKKVLVKYVVKERCYQFRRVYWDIIWLDLSEK